MWAKVLAGAAPTIKDTTIPHVEFTEPCTVDQSHQHGARRIQVACKGHVGRPLACFENTIKMVRIVT